MKEKTHVVKYPPQLFHIAQGRIEIHQLRAWTDNYIWVMYDVIKQHAVVIDGPDAAPLYEWLSERNCKSLSVWNTHHHPDHVGINKSLLTDKRFAKMDIVGAAQRAADIPGITQLVSEGDELMFGGEVFEVWQTDGHVDGHLCFVHSELVFCGDTLFAGGCGFLFDGPPDAMFESLARLSRLGEHVKVCCAHEYTVDNLKFAHFIEPDSPAIAERLKNSILTLESGMSTLPSTIGLERATNPFLRCDSAGLQSQVRQLTRASLVTPEDFFAATRKLKDKKVHR